MVANRWRRAFTLLEVATVFSVLAVVLGITFVSYTAIRHSQENNRAQITLMSAVLSQRSVAAATGAYLPDPADLQQISPGSTIVGSDIPSDDEYTVSMGYSDGQLWLVSQGHTCQYTLLRGVEERMAAESGTVDSGPCTADNAEAQL